MEIIASSGNGSTYSFFRSTMTRTFITATVVFGLIGIVLSGPAARPGGIDYVPACSEYLPFDHLALQVNLADWMLFAFIALGPVGAWYLLRRRPAGVMWAQAIVMLLSIAFTTILLSTTASLSGQLQDEFCQQHGTPHTQRTP